MNDFLPISNACVVAFRAGRRPFTQGLNLEGVGVATDSRGCIVVDGHFQSSVPGIFAIGDVIPGPMLAHKVRSTLNAETGKPPLPRTFLHCLLFLVCRQKRMGWPAWSFWLGTAAMSTTTPCPQFATRGQRLLVWARLRSRPRQRAMSIRWAAVSRDRMGGF